ncbi:8511_t:CDS:2 [Racocetra persica]|uniref:8511_t:CDS:1 n=1 Tax=Racocetra persica TaxID=160502 RepID=A0ACA9L067_9GLOM|nr:8511_t:CDS:2 [Racocetra persica]
MNSQYSIAHKSTPYEIVFRKPPHYDTNLANLFENNNYSHSPTEKSSPSLVSETDSQATIKSGLNNDAESPEIDPFYSEEMRQDNSDVNNNADEEINSRVNINFNSDTDKEMYSNMDEDEDEVNIQNNFIQDYSEARIISKEIVIIDDSDNDSGEDQRYAAQEKEKWRAYSDIDKSDHKV